jgi:uncharacterized repeat protein (TIGR01451 family)
MKRLAFALLIAIAVALSPVSAQNQAEADPADVAANPVEVRLEIFLVSEVQGTEQFRPATTARPGQVVEYRLTAVNRSQDTLPRGTVEIVGPIPDRTTYVVNSATPSSDKILAEYSADGGQTFTEEPVLLGAADERRVAEPQTYDAVRWTLLVPMEPGQEEAFFYRVTVDDD